MYSRIVRVSLPLITSFVLLILVGVTIVFLLSRSSARADPNYDCTTVSEISQSECEALVALYNATDGPNWTDNTDWLATNTPCSWYGILCGIPTVGSFYVAGINLEYNNLSGIIPPEIGDLPDLGWLYLYGNELTDIPPEIGNLSNLELLWVDHNQLTSVPPEIGNLSSLRSLLLADNNLTSIPSTIGNLSNLQYLYLMSAQLTSIPPEIGNLTNLTELYLYDNQLTSVPSEIGNLTNLASLYLNSNQLTAVPSEIVNLTNLTHLSLRDNQLTSLPLEIGTLTSLTDLQLHSNPLSGPIPTELTNLTNLSRINFYDTRWCAPDTPAFNAWLDSINDVQGTGFVCGQSPGAISGTVSAATPLTGIQAALYRDIDPSWSRWILVDTAPVNNVGQYVFNNLGEGIEYRVHFEDEAGNYAPEYYDNVSTIDTATAVTATLGMTRTGINAVLGLSQPPIIDVETDSGSVNVNPLDGTVTVNMTQGNRSDITVTRTVTCTGGAIPSLVELQLEMSTETIPYTMSSIGNDQYQVTIPEADIAADAMLKIKASCGGIDETTTVGTVNLYDPSGNITNMFTHEPIVGATVTLYKVPNWRPRTSPSDMTINSCESNDSKAAGVPWSQHAPTDEGVIVNTEFTTVAPLLSHQQTDADGHYGWDVPKGCWYVVVRADGYETLTSPVVGVPPEVTDLDLALAPEGSSMIFLPMIVK